MSVKSGPILIIAPDGVCQVAENEETVHAIVGTQDGWRAVSVQALLLAYDYVLSAPVIPNHLRHKNMVDVALAREAEASNLTQRDGWREVTAGRWVSVNGEVSRGTYFWHAESFYRGARSFPTLAEAQAWVEQAGPSDPMRRD